MEQKDCSKCARPLSFYNNNRRRRRISGTRMAKTVAATGSWKIEIVTRSDAKCFVVTPKRWIFERIFAWISRNRRLMRYFEGYSTTTEAFVRL